MSKLLPNFSKFLLLCRNGPILLLILLGGPRECIQDIVSTVVLWDRGFENTYFTDLNEFHVEIIPNFSKFLLLCKIGPILLLILLGGPRECIQDIISTVENFCGIADLKTRISLF